MELTKEEKTEKQIALIIKFKRVHGDKYDYSKFIYVNAKTKVCIICPEHGEFWQRPDHHLNGVGCPMCAGVSLMSFDDFCKKANTKHNSKYSYVEDTYSKTSKKVGIICPEHGLFYQNASSHLTGCGCPLCNGGIGTTKEKYIKKAILIHGNYYDYSKIEYINAKTKICIMCPRHGEFWQEADSHLYGKGCPKCKSSILESMVINILNKNKIFYQFQYKLDGMGKKSYDFYLPDTKLIIECQGEQHFVPVNFRKNSDDGNVNKDFTKRVDLDYEKYNVAIKHGIKVIYFTLPKLFKDKNVNINLPFYFDKKVFQHTDDLLLYINSLEKSAHIDNNNNVLFRDYLMNISNDFIFQDGAFVNKNYKIYLIECHSNERDTLNSISRINRKRDYDSIFIFEDEWINNKELVKNKLKHLIKMNSNLPKIGARKCTIIEINKDLERDFLNKYHIQGNGQSTVAYGAFYNDELVGVMAFKKLFKNRNEYELTRFTTNYTYIFQGLGSKMLSHFINNYNPNSIVSFADKRWTTDKDNNLYTKLGFSLEYQTYPDYRYYNETVDRYKRFHKFNFRKQILNKKYGLDLSLTETEMVKILGYDRIWDCGLLKYKLEIKKENN